MQTALGSARCGGVQKLVVEEASSARIGADGLRRQLPFDFGGQALASPLCEGLGLVVGHVGHRGLFVQRQQAGEREFQIFAVALLPVERSPPAFLVDGLPTVFQPVAKVGIGAIADKFEILAIGYQAGVQAVSLITGVSTAGG